MKRRMLNSILAFTDNLCSETRFHTLLLVSAHAKSAGEFLGIYYVSLIKGLPIVAVSAWTSYSSFF